MLLYYLFWMFMGLLCTFILFLGLTYKPEAQCKLLFFAYFSVSQKRNIKRNPNGMKPSRGSFLEQTQSRRLGVEVKEATRRPRGSHEVGGRAYPPRCASLPRDRLVASLTSTPSLLDCVCSKTIAPKGFIPFGLRLIFLFFETLK